MFLKIKSYLFLIQKTYTTKSVIEEVEAKRKRLHSSNIAAKQKVSDYVGHAFYSQAGQLWRRPCCQRLNYLKKMHLTNTFRLKSTRKQRKILIANVGRLGKVDLISSIVPACATATTPIGVNNNPRLRKIFPRSYQICGSTPKAQSISTLF